jgi:SUMO ligase MMS21 Smc5/6 complex component
MTSLETIKEEKDMDKDCPICLEKMDDAFSLTSACNHTFHETCLNKWLEKSPTCPYCRTDY